jgi:hypothetical protein
VRLCQLLQLLLFSSCCLLLILRLLFLDGCFLLPPLLLLLQLSVTIVFPVFLQRLSEPFGSLSGCSAFLLQHILKVR